ncbi:MAG: hypothetical protein JOY77_14400 [Alphaproteobacteria bacterium]|nr:hypothetical protein [Alphaproteobacteria bacterium]MBV9064098.1 hypothetical protein [Alphaproteobacteria bacterium]
MPKPVLKDLKNSVTNGLGAQNDGRQVASALARVKDPMLRYVIAQLLDILTERIEALEGGALPSGQIEAAGREAH